MSTTIFMLSVALQLAAALVAASQIRRSGSFWPYWSAITVALLLMVVRRELPLFSHSFGADVSLESPIQLITGFLISLFMAIGLIGVRNLFLELQWRGEELKRLSREDPLTGYFNRRYCAEFGEMLFTQSIRYDRPFSVILFDLDHFKSINDTHGHEVGDRVLRLSANRMRSALRNVDVLGRWGGDEFLVILPETDIVAARTVANRVIDLFRRKDGSLPTLLGTSAGVTCFKPGDHAFADLLVRADQAMYAAKRAGGNRVKAA